MDSSLHEDRAILAVLEPLALSAGRRIMDICRQGFETLSKSDCSPVTQADRDAEEIILRGLRASFPGAAVIAEEEMSAGRHQPVDPSLFFLVDPLDGTREFISGNGDFTVNIALIREYEPVVGVVYAPACGKLFLGRPGFAEMAETNEDHQPVLRRAISVRTAGMQPTIVASRSHRTPETDEYIARFGAAEYVTVGSSLKFCLLASGEADLYPRLGRTMQWDTAAGDAILRAAGGMTRTLDGKPFRYGAGTAPGDVPFANPYFIAEGRLVES